MELSKYESLGNDYLVLGTASPRPAPALVARLCRPHTGLGADGVLWPAPAAGAHGVRVLNPDGSEAAISGNGMRIYARALLDRGLVAADAPVVVDTGGRRVTVRVAGDGRTATVAMGPASFDSGAIPLAGARRMVAAETLLLAGERVTVWPVSVGNPHCVLFDRPVTPAAVRELGPLLESHPLFPQRTNVQLAAVVDRRTLRIEIWERGAGYTLASGSSACGVAAVARRRGLVDDQVTVLMTGGRLDVTFDRAEGIHHTGPVRHVFSGRVSEEWLAAA